MKRNPGMERQHMKKTFYVLYVIILIALFAGGGLFVLFKTPDEYSKNENRYLEKLPELSWDSVKNGEFQKKVEKALTDQLPMRDVMTGLSTSFRRFALLHDVGDVYLGKDNYYFDKKLEKDFNSKQYNKNLAMVRRFFDTSGVKDHKLMLIPSPATVLKEKLPTYAKIYDETPYVVTAKSMFSNDFVDVRPAFEAAKKGSQLYFRTDHHWTHEGAYIAYRTYIGETDRDAVDLGSMYNEVSKDFYGTMYSRALDNDAIPDSISIPKIPEGLTVTSADKEIPLYNMDKLKEKDQYAVYFGGNDPLVTIDNYFSSKGGTLFVIKDSFANSIVPLLSYGFSKIVMVDLRYETRPMKMLLDMYKPDHVLVLYEMSNFASSTEVAKLGV